MSIERLWLCFSPQTNRPYCQSCWLFGDKSAQQKQWTDGVPGNPRNYGLKIKSHEKTAAHRIACNGWVQWKAGQLIDREHQITVQKEVTFWRQVLMRVINIILTLATSLAFRCHRESIGDESCYGGNFLGLVAMQARFDHVLKELIQIPARHTKYLSPKIQNELIQVISKLLRNQLLSKIQTCAFYSTIVDTTSDTTRSDQVSIVLRWVSIDGGSVTIQETFLSFVHTTVSTAEGLAELVSKWLVEHGLDLCKIRSQGYDGALVMSGKIGAVQKRLQDIISTACGVTVRAPLVHCASHNLNLVINYAAAAVIKGVNLFGVISESFNFFGRSLNRWAELALTEDGMKKLKLKKLCTTRWSSRIDAVRAMKNCYADILKVLMRIILTSKDSKERADATALTKNIDNFNFVYHNMGDNFNFSSSCFTKASDH